MTKKRIGILGGTFDPIHNGHLYIAENARHFMQLDEVVFIPSANPPHKTKKNITAAHHRLAMCSLAIANNSHFSVSDIELRRTGLSYTLITLQELQGLYGESTDIFFIIGADMLMDLPNWYQAAELLENHNFIAVARQGLDLSAISSSSILLQQYSHKLTLLNILPLDISATAIRRTLAQGAKIRYIVPEAVYNYIIDMKLYLD